MKVDEQLYAKALVKNGIFDNIDAALLEAQRFNEKVDDGLSEPLKCYPNPDCSVSYDGIFNEVTKQWVVKYHYS